MRCRISRLAGALLMAICTQAQTSRGTGAGTITDPSASLVEGATIALTNIATGARLSTTSNKAGICGNGVALGRRGTQDGQPE